MMKFWMVDVVFVSCGGARNFHTTTSTILRASSNSCNHFGGVYLYLLHWRKHIFIRVFFYVKISCTIGYLVLHVAAVLLALFLLAAFRSTTVLVVTIVLLLL